jgi:four helix bundle protein
MGDFKDLKAWQRNRLLTRALYAATESFPAIESVGTVSQIRRAATSIGCNLAEGSSSPSDREQARYYRIALGSGRELESLLLTAGDVGLIEPEQANGFVSELDQICRMIGALIKYASGGTSPKAKRNIKRAAIPATQPSTQPQTLD